MKALSSSTWLCLGLTFLCVLQSIHLNYIFRKPLHTTAPSQYPHQVDEHQTATSEQTPPPQDIGSLTTEIENPLIDDTLLSDEPSNLFYFIQVSDLHISKFRSQTERFLHFVQSVLPVVRPSFVVVTGDLTDAKDVGDIKTVQYEEEWMLYKNAIDQGTTNGQENGLPWYDMRGNHDCFDMPSWESNVNLYRTFGKSAHLLEEGQGVYSWQMKQNYGNYRFVAMDACPKKGPARPLNFYGYVTTNTMDRLESTLLDETTFNHTFLFTHYPTTTMVFGLGDILKSYHTATKSLELELGDMKDHGVYRIVAVDHDLVSFVDVELPLDAVQPRNDDPYRFPLEDNNTILWPDKLQLPPVILITNPKDGRYFLNEKEPTHRILDSTHMRFLIFSPHEPSTLKVRVFVDNKRHPFPTTYSGNKGTTASSPPLWTTPWSPEDFDDITTHSLRVEVTAPDGQVGESEIFFRVDGVRLMIGGGFGEWLIGTSVANIVSQYGYK
ncbi:Metallo-dependent phosphatase-like protein [Absidia repens]|uniref:Metallo-dependent phosphatase-like protein n=1 Tax=Absidia repens TaxID=90262 RepID=A0A1X2I4D6_9FUNG|nr:Metallo-dependent phosphatase-like protein [Absidia repens]